MKTLVLPVINWRFVEQMDVEYLRQYWSEMLLGTGSWSAALREFGRQRRLLWEGGPDLRSWEPYVLAVAVTYRDEIQILSARLNLEANTEPLPGLRPEAARSAAPA